MGEHSVDNALKFEQQSEIQFVQQKEAINCRRANRLRQVNISQVCTWHQADTLNQNNPQEGFQTKRFQNTTTLFPQTSKTTRKTGGIQKISPQLQ